MGHGPNSIPHIDELEDYLELQDPEVRRIIEESRKDYQEGRTRPAEDFLAELRGEVGPHDTYR